LRIRPRSIRSKLAIAFLLAFGALLSVQVAEVVHDVRRVGPERAWLERALATPVGQARWDAVMESMSGKVKADLTHAEFMLVLSLAAGLVALAAALGWRIGRCIRLGDFRGRRRRWRWETTVEGSRFRRVMSFSGSVSLSTRSERACSSMKKR